MVGTTLGKIRRYVDAMAVDDGDYYVVCSRTGEQPAPVAGKRFVSRSTARSALGATEQYRAALRSYDPSIPYYDLIVCQADDRGSASAPDGGDSGGTDAWSGGRSAFERTGGSRIEFCHDVAGALFEALVENDRGRVERAIMDAYVERAEQVADPDELCLRLLETAVQEIEAGLTAADRRRLFDDAVDRLPPTGTTPVPIERSLARLVSMSFVDEYHVRRDVDESDRACTVTLVNYALARDDRRIPTLPLAIDLRRRYRGTISIPRAVHRGGRDWQLDLRLAGGEAAGGSGLFSAPVREP